MAIETLFQRILSLTDILHPTQPARNEINNVSSIACDVTDGLVRSTRRMARKGLRLKDVVLTDNTTRSTLEGTMLDGGGCLKGRDFCSDNQVPQVAWPSVGQDGIVRSSSSKAI